jgi:hypothetical protein
MTRGHMKKPSNGCNRYLGQQRTFGKQAAINNYSSYKANPLPTPEDFYEQEIEGFSVGSDSWASGCCPFHDDHNPSFAMNLESGGYFCRSSNCGAKGGNMVTFVCALHGLTPRDAYRFLEARA